MLARLAVLLIALPAVAVAAADTPAGGGGRIAVVAQRAKPAETQADVADAAPTAPAPIVSAASPLATPPPDGGECRIGCAQAYYFCRVGDQTGDCAPTWSQCVAACDLPNLNSGVSTAP